jgi:hypothetical protein
MHLIDIKLSKFEKLREDWMPLIWRLSLKIMVEIWFEQTIIASWDPFFKKVTSKSVKLQSILRLYPQDCPKL